jgi:hypothetical protein
MLPVAVYEKLANDNYLQTQCGINGSRIFELQSIDERPVDDGFFIVINWQESTIYSQTYTGMRNGITKAPRVMMVWVHSPKDTGRNYRPIDKILNRIDELLLPIEHEIGSDGIRVSCVAKQGRSGNLIDDGWKTIARNATYGVLYDESTA